MCIHHQRHHCITGDRLIFLNLESPFVLRAINWHPAHMSKLWRYNLHYFDYVQGAIDEQDATGSLDKTTRDFLIQHWIDHNPYPQEDAWEPYPTSLRIINWIKYFHLIGHASIPQAWLKSLYQQGHYLCQHIEWHIEANHLFKNIIALVIWSHYFNDAFAQGWQKRSCAFLASLCKEQFLQDGGHYERSPMYHFILIYHLLDVYNCLKSTTGAAPDWLHQTLRRGLIYCHTIVKPDGRLPLIKDTAAGIAPDLQNINSYAEQLGLWPAEYPQQSYYYLEQSGYVVHKSAGDYILFDVGNIAPSHQPGHAHCDALHMEITWNGRDIFTDSGVFNYVASSERQTARSVRAHNTLSINGQEQHNIWDAFRIAQRGRTENIKISSAYSSAEFYPYFSRQRHIGHKRSIQIPHTGSIHLVDTLLGSGRASAEIFWHLAPGLTPSASSSTDGRTIEIRDEDDLLVAVIKLQHKQVIPIFTHSEYFPEFGKRQLRHCVIFQLNDMQLPVHLAYQIHKVL